MTNSEMKLGATDPHHLEFQGNKYTIGHDCVAYETGPCNMSYYLEALCDADLLHQFQCLSSPFNLRQSA